MEFDEIRRKEKIYSLKKQLSDLENPTPLSEIEKSFRAGYLYGFTNGQKNPEQLLGEVLEWSHSFERIQPPGHPYSGEYREDYK